MNFDQLYTKYNQAIFRLCLGYTNDQDWAKDIVQETFIAVWKNLDKFRGDALPSTWIYRIAVNNCIKQIERKKRNARNMEWSETETAVTEENTKLVLLRKFIAALSEVDRLIISMELEEMPQAEIAEIMGISNGNVRIRIHRIKEILGKKFKSAGYV